jgi:hypothetical protein
MDYNELGDVQALDKIQAELGSMDQSAVNESAEQAAQLEKNNGVAFPYDPVLAQSVKVYMGIGSNIAAGKWGDHWQLKEDEADALSVASCQLITHYFPDMEPTNPLMNFAMVMGVVIGPRVLLTAVKGKQQKAEKDGVENESKHK